MDEEPLITDEATEARVMQFIELSPSDQSLVLSLLDQAKKLRKGCPKWKAGRIACPEAECPDGTIAPASQCHGSGSIPVTAEDVDLVKMVKAINDNICDDDCCLCKDLKEAVNGLTVAEDVEVKLK